MRFIIRKNTTKIDPKERGVTSQTAGTAGKGKPSTSPTATKIRKARPTTSFPGLGQPVGLDDPKRKGISLARVK